MRYRLPVFSMLPLLMIFLFTSCKNEPKGPPNIVFIIADDISWNDFSCYGNEDVNTPYIDRLAREGLKFNNVYLTASSCSPSRSSIISGRYPHNTGAAELHTPLPGHLPVFPGELQKAGYHTAASGKWHMGDAAKRGFDTLAITDIGPGGEKHWLNLLKERPKDRPFFMWFASTDAHRDWSADTLANPYDPASLGVPSGLADLPGTRQDLASYYNEIKRFDWHVGEVHREIIRQGEAPNTVIIVCADNGRPFPRAKTRMIDAGMKTPFILWWPQGIARHGSEKDALVSIIDLAPTLADLAGLAPDRYFQGRSFKHLVRNEDAPDTFRKTLFAEHNWHDYEAYGRMVRTEEYMYIYNGRPQFAKQGPADAVISPSMQDIYQLLDSGSTDTAMMDVLLAPRPAEELYRVADDPDQLNNLSGDPQYAGVLAEMRMLLKEWQSATADTEPEQLTADWYLRKADAYIQTEQHGIRGEMPGDALGADTVTNGGPF